jgi:hypothetical protein
MPIVNRRIVRFTVKRRRVETRKLRTGLESDCGKREALVETALAQLFH